MDENEQAYFDAIRKGDTATLRRLVAEHPELLRATTSPSYAPEKPLRCTGLHSAIHTGRAEAARVLVDAGIDIEARTVEGRTALHDSIEFGHGTITEMLLERGAVMDVCSAAILGRLERLRELLDADPELVNDRSTGLSPLGWASYGNRIDSATELLERGARMDDGELLCAASVGHVEVGRLLLERGADPDEIHAEAGGNALHAAASMRYTCDSSRFVRMLLEHGVDIEAPSGRGKTALEIAEERARLQERNGPDPEGGPREYAKVAALLREHGAGRAT